MKFRLLVAVLLTFAAAGCAHRAPAQPAAKASAAKPSVAKKPAAKLAAPPAPAATTATPVAQPDPDAPREVRAIWVTRWDYSEPADVRRIMENCAELGFNTILFQARGNGTVYYRSEIEPWAWELTSDGPETTGKDPGWDPMAVAVEEAHARGLELHAYVNVFPAWRTQNYPPRDSGQLWWEHPDWFMCDAAGRRMVPRDHNANPKVGDWYAFLSPGVPEVQDYLAALFTELATNYAIDGIHYDYVRFPAEIREVAEPFADRARKLGNWSYDPVSLARFQNETGIAAPDLDPEAWSAWRATQVTETVRKIRDSVHAVRPNVVFTAAVMANPEDARATKYQDYVGWLETGLLDAAITMNYTGNIDQFRDRSAMLLEPRPAKGFIVQGLGLRNGDEIIAKQLEFLKTLGADGFAFFAYSNLFDRDKKHVKKALANQMGRIMSKTPARTPWQK